MKKFRFKLDGFLKFRELKEMRAKTEFGNIVRERNILEESIEESRRDMQTAYASLEYMAEKRHEARDLQLFSLLIDGHRKKIGSMREGLRSLEGEYEQKKVKMRNARADLKVVENIKERKFESFKREVEKKELMDLEDIMRMRDIGNKAKNED